jgi:hypothetical protein
MKITKFLLITVVLTLLCSMPQKAMALTNGGFETGSTGWSDSGDTALADNTFGSGPTEGLLQFLLSNTGEATDYFSISETDSVSASELETFLGLTPGSLTGLGAVEGSAVQQSFTANAGTTLTFDWNFLTDEPQSQANDIAFVVIDGVVTTLPDVNTALQGSSLTEFMDETGFSTFSLVFSTSGTHTLGFGVVDVTDDVGASGLLVDNISIRVHIPDANLKAAIEQTLGVTDPTPVDMLDLTSLAAYSSNIADLTGLEYAANLTSLILSSNQISDISALSGLINLNQLILPENPLIDISPLGGLTNLYSLNLSTTQISNISALSGLTNLSRLIIGFNQISDISVLSGLANLNWLNIGVNQISDISALSGLTNLTNLYMGNNPLGTGAICTDIPTIISNNPGIEIEYSTGGLNDTDGDGEWDVCEADMDGDAIANEVDTYPLVSSNAFSDTGDY